MKLFPSHRAAVLRRSLPAIRQVFARRADGHGNSHRRAFRRVHPRMIGNRKKQRKWRLGGHLRLHHATRKSLAQAVRGDEAKAFHTPGAGKFGGFVPPIQNEIGGFRHVGISGAKRFGITVAQIFPHPRRADERRIADDEIRLRPLGRASGSRR